MLRSFDVSILIRIFAAEFIIYQKNMARYLFDTSEIFFPVDLCRLYWESPDKRDMFGNLHNVCDDFYAVVDLEKDYVFATVTKDYELILNLEAAELGFDLLAHLFRLPDYTHCYASNYWMTAKRSECEIDIVLDYDAAPSLSDDGWRPMMKVVNSYNKKRKPTFYFGFCQVDNDGVIQAAFLISGFSLELNSRQKVFVDTLRDILFERVDRNPDMDVQRIEQLFKKKMERLKAISLTQRNMLTLCGEIFGFAPGSVQNKLSDARQNAISLIKQHVPMKRGRGDAYAFFTAMAAYASTYEKFTRRAQTTRSQLQLGAWIDDFLKTSPNRRRTERRTKRA